MQRSNNLFKQASINDLLQYTGFRLFFFCALCFAIIFANSRLAETSLSKHLSTVSTVIAQQIAISAKSKNKGSTSEILTAIEHYSDIAFICQYDEDGNILATHSNTPSVNQCEINPPREQKSTTDNWFNSSLIVKTPVLLENKTIGHIVIYSKQHYSYSIQTIYIILLASVLFAFSVLIKWLKKNYTQPQFISLPKEKHDEKQKGEKPFSQQASKLLLFPRAPLLTSENNNTHFENSFFESESKFRLLADLSPVGIFLQNQLLSYEYTNAKWSEISGLASTRVLDFRKHIKPDDLERCIDLQNAAKESEEPQILDYEFTTPEGEKKFLIERITPLIDKSGFKGFVGSLADATELKIAQVELEKLAFFDPLTELANRRFFLQTAEDALSECQAKGQQLSLLMTDLDSFKQVNDTLGHDIGDALLKAIGSRLQRLQSNDIIIGRMGGDEFTILIKNSASNEKLEKTIQQVLNTINEKVFINQKELNIGGSVGAAIYPLHAQSYIELSRMADIALYKAKASGGNQAFVYSEEYGDMIQNR